MAKRKQNRDDVDDREEDSGSDVSLIDVDFEFFDPNPEIDYIALKRLIVQQFNADADVFVPHELANLILSQPLVGTTVKTDGKESDPYAVLTVLNMHVHREHPSIRALSSYILSKSASNAPAQASLQTILSADPSNTAQVGFVFSERLINMPVQVVPPMYRMLANEIRWAVEENEPYAFTHYIFVTRTYRLSAADASAMAIEVDSSEAASRPSKRRKNRPQVQAAQQQGPGTYSFHPEDECIQKFAMYTIDYNLSSQPQGEERSAESFGLDVGGRLMVVTAERFAALVNALAEAYGV